MRHLVQWLAYWLQLCTYQKQERTTFGARQGNELVLWIFFGAFVFVAGPVKFI